MRSICFLLIILTTLPLISNCRYLHHSLKNLSLKEIPTKSKNSLSFLHNYLNQQQKKKWHYLGDRPAHDIKYKLLIARAFKDLFFILYKNLMDDHRMVRLIFGKTRKVGSKKIIKLVFVIKHNHRNTAYLGVELRVPQNCFNSETANIEILRFGKSVKCKDVLNLLHISLQEFKFGPSVEFLNSSKAGHHLWRHFGVKDRGIYQKDLHQVIKMEILKFNAWLANSGLLAIHTRNVDVSKPKIHPLMNVQPKAPKPAKLVNIGSGFDDDSEFPV